MSGKLVGQVLELALPQHEKYVAVTLANFGDDDGGRIFPSVAQLARLTGYSERRVQQILRALQDRGLIAPVANIQGGRGKATEYRMNTAKGEILPPLADPGKGEMGEAGFTVSEAERVKPATQRVKSEAKRVKPVTQKGETIVAPHPSLNPSEDPSEDPSLSAAVAAPPSVPPTSPASSRPLTQQQAEVGVWSRVMDLDISIPANAKRVGNMLTGLRRSKLCQPSVEVAETYWLPEGAGAWNYWRDTWQGQRNQPPTEREINQYWGAWLKPTTNGNGHPARAAPVSPAQARADANLAIIARLTDPDPPPNVIEGRFRHGK